MNIRNETEFTELRKKLKKFASNSKKGIQTSRFDSSDIAQLSCIQIWQAWKEVEESGLDELVVNNNLLRKICHGKSSNLVRFHLAKRRSATNEEQFAENADQSADDPKKIVEIDEQKELMTDALSELDDIHRELVVLRYIGELTLAEIGERMEKSVDWVHRHLRKALSQLASILNES